LLHIWPFFGSCIFSQRPQASRGYAMVEQPQIWDELYRCDSTGHQVYRHAVSGALVLSWEEVDADGLSWTHSYWIADEVVGLVSTRKGMVCVPIHRNGRVRAAYVSQGLAIFVASVQPGVILGPDRRYFA